MPDKNKDIRLQDVKHPNTPRELSTSEKEALAQALERQAAELRKPKPIEFPKAVRFKDQERIFQTRAAQDAAGPDWAD